MSLSLIRPTVPTIGRVGSSEDVLEPRPRMTLRREIMAVVVPAWAEPGRDMTAYARAPRDVVGEAAEAAHQAPEGRRGRHGDRRRPARVPAPPRGPRRAAGPAAGDGLPRRRGLRPPRLPRRGRRPRRRLGSDHPQAGRRDAPSSTPTRQRSESVRQRDLQPPPARDAQAERPPRIGLWSFSHQVLLATIGSVVLPFLALVAAYLLGIDVSDALYWVLVGGAVDDRADDLVRVLARPRATRAPRRAGPSPRRGQRR